MATLEDLDDMERDEKEEKQNNDKDGKKDVDANGDATMPDAEEKKKANEEEDPIDLEILDSSTRDIINRKRLLDNDTRIMKSEFSRLNHEKTAMNEKIKDNMDKIENNR